MPFLVPFLAPIGAALSGGALAGGAAALAGGAALAGTGASIAGSLGQGGAIKSAANTQAAADQAAIAEQQRQFNVNQTNQQPFIQAGQQAVGAQGDLLGLNGNDAQSAAIARLQTSPGYQSLYHNGEQAVLSNGSATGGLRGGNTERSLYGLGTDTLSKVINDHLTALGGVAGQGTTTASNLGQQGSAVSGNIGSILQSQGQAQAGGILGSANANGTALNSLAGLLGRFTTPGALSSLGGGGYYGSPAVSGTGPAF